MKTILVPLDGSALAEHALPFVRTLALLLGARVRLLTVIVDDQRESLMAESIAASWHQERAILGYRVPFRRG
jgi:nucleotide-binding universal stress UspA family protein